MASANPDRVPLNLFINMGTNEDLEYLARRRDTYKAEIVRAAIQHLAFLERQVEQGAIVIMHINGRDVFLMAPGTTGRAAFDRAQLVAEHLWNIAPPKE